MVAVARFHISMRESASTTTMPSAMEAMIASDFSFSCATRWYRRAFWSATVAELANASSASSSSGFHTRRRRSYSASTPRRSPSGERIGAPR